MGYGIGSRLRMEASGVDMCKRIEAMKNRCQSFGGVRLLRSGSLGMFLILLLADAWGQTQVLVQYDGELRTVVALDGSYPLVVDHGQRVAVTEGSVKVLPAESYTDGAVEVLQQDAIMGQDYGSGQGGFFFRFDAMVRAERDFEDCFVLFVITPEMGDATYVLREVPDINVIGQERILVTLPVNPGFGGGKFGYKLFSRGEEIRVESNGALVSIRDNSREGRAAPATSIAEPIEREERDAEGFGEPAKAVKARLLDFPKSLLGKVSGGYAEAVYSVDTKGKVFEVLELSGDYPELLPEAWKTITQSVYQPGHYNGKALVTTIRQRFFFNEFAPFAEEMVMIPYPTHYRDRDPIAMFAPGGSLSGSEGGTVAVEGTVNRLGKLTDISVSDPVSQEKADAALEAAKRWLFLPAMSKGYAVERRMRVAVPLN